MATLQQFTDSFSRLNTATTGLATVLKDVRDKVAALETSAGITAGDEESVLGQLDGAAAALEAMAQDPEKPVPVEIPTV